MKTDYSVFKITLVLSETAVKLCCVAQGVQCDKK